MNVLLLKLLQDMIKYTSQKIYYISSQASNVYKGKIHKIFLLDQEGETSRFGCVAIQLDLEYGFLFMGPLSEQALNLCTAYNFYGASTNPVKFLGSNLELPIRKVTLWFSGEPRFLEYSKRLHNLQAYCRSQDIPVLCCNPFVHGSRLTKRYAVDNVIRSRYNLRDKNSHIKYFISEEDTQRVEMQQKADYFNNKTNSFTFFTEDILTSVYRQNHADQMSTLKMPEYYVSWYDNLRNISSNAIFGRLDLYKTAGNSTNTTLQAGQIYDFWFSSLFLVEGVSIGMAHWRENYLYFALVCKDKNIYQIQFDISKMYENIDWYNEYTDINNLYWSI